MTLTKRDLVLRISEKTDMKQVQVLSILQKILDEICEALAEGHKVELRNFGVFEAKVREARTGRNPNAPRTSVQIPARAVVKFKSGKQMRLGVRRLCEPPNSGAPNPPTA